jgi:hypothetical protein
VESNLELDTRRVPNGWEVKTTPRSSRSSDAIRDGIVMVSEGAQPSGIDLVRPEPRPGIPTQLQASVVLWLFAIAAGLFEAAAETVVATDSGRCYLRTVLDPKPTRTLGHQGPWCSGGAAPPQTAR